LWAKTISHVKVERIVVLGLKNKPHGVSVAGQGVEWSWDSSYGVTASDASVWSEARSLLRNTPPFEVELKSKDRQMNSPRSWPNVSPSSKYN
jgi:hypothetical protein